jgi:hypothetical protein
MVNCKMNSLLHSKLSNKNLFFTFLSLIFFFLAFPNITKANSIIFQDNFDDGNANDWTVQRSMQWGSNDDPCMDGGITINGDGCVTEITPNTWNGSLSEYIVDLDMEFIGGTDKNLAFRYGDPSHWYDLKFDSAANTVSYQLIPYDGPYSVSYSIPNGSTYHIKIEIKNGQITTWIDGNQVIQAIYNPNNESSPMGKLALQASVGADPSSEVYFDNILVTSIDTAIPTPSPTVAPTPTPFPIPNYSQRDNRWKNDVYDHANTWSPTNSSMERWGCAVTAASTVLGYYHIDNLPAIPTQNPGTLNAWLKTQSDGYLREGALNWLAVSRVSKLANTNNSSLPVLEYSRAGSDIVTLHNELDNFHPVILEEPNHFITAYQFDNVTNTTSIRDPFYPMYTTLASYGNTFLSQRRFTPPNGFGISSVSANLGYLLVTSDSDIHSYLYIKKNASFDPLSTQTFIQNPLRDDIDGTRVSGDPFNEMDYSKPDNGEYEIVLTRNTPGLGSYEIYVYDQSGNPVLKKETSLFTSSPIFYQVRYGNTNTIQKIITFESLVQEIITAKNNGYFRPQYNASELISLLKNAEKLYAKQPQASKTLFLNVIKLLDGHSKFITSEAYSLIRNDTLTAFSQFY